MGELAQDREFLAKLEYLYVLSKRLFSPRKRLDRRLKRVGSGVEFSDHREYTPGDDYRYLDWLLYGRLERLFLKLFEEEEDRTVYFLLDASRSMSGGDPPKLEYAKRVVAALVLFAQCGDDDVTGAHMAADCHE